LEFLLGGFSSTLAGVGADLGTRKDHPTEFEDVHQKVGLA